MRSIFVLITLIMAAGMASAGWYPQNVYNFSGTIEQDTTLAAGKLGGANGADTLTSTDASASLSVVSDGTNYLIISKVGTWT